LSISSISVKENTVFPVHFDCAFLKEQIHGHLFSIVGWYNHLLAIELISDNLGRTS